MQSTEAITWKEAWSSGSFRWQVYITFSVIVIMAFLAPHFFDFIEGRHGKQLPDPFLDLFPNYNVSWLVFFILYSGVVIGFYHNVQKPMHLLIMFQTYSFVMFMRIITLSFIPLEPPIGYIPLREPLVQMLLVSDGRIISKDLFFSGHMSTLLAVAFSMGKSVVRWMLFTFAFILAILLFIQHVHYTIDILAAPFGALLANVLARKVSGMVIFR
jgi:hypothetical protein